jgi:hypothetical protein
MLEKFYSLAERLSIKIITIEEVLIQEANEMNKKEKRVGNISMFDKKYRTIEQQYNDFIKLYFNDISTLPLLSAEEEREIARRIKR